MTYNVFGGTLNLAQPQPCDRRDSKAVIICNTAVNK